MLLQYHHCNAIRLWLAALRTNEEMHPYRSLIRNFSCVFFKYRDDPSWFQSTLLILLLPPLKANIHIEMGYPPSAMLPLTLLHEPSLFAHTNSLT